MIKRFCDGCGDEITDRNKEGTKPNSLRFCVDRRFKSAALGIDTTLEVEVITGKDGVTNAGDWCRFCIIDAVNMLDTRPRSA